MAIDANTGTKWFSALGFDPKFIPQILTFRWTVVEPAHICFSLSRYFAGSGDPDVVDLYIDCRRHARPRPTHAVTGAVAL